MIRLLLNRVGAAVNRFNVDDDWIKHDDCPFCGGRTVKDAEEEYTIRCLDCGATGSGGDYGSIEAEGWSRDD